MVILSKFWIHYDQFLII